MNFETPNGKKMVEIPPNGMRQNVISSINHHDHTNHINNSLIEPSPTMDHLRIRNFSKTRAMGHRNILSDLEDKIQRRNNEIYRPMIEQAQNSRATRSREFRNHVRERKDDRVMNNREYVNYKQSKAEHERIMNEIARNMSLPIEAYLALEESIDAILGFSDEIYDSKARPRHFDMIDDDDEDYNDGGNADFEASTQENRSPEVPLVKSEELMQKELEEYLRLQEEELEYLTSNLSLN